jgi:hypothetical protein
MRRFRTVVGVVVLGALALAGCGPAPVQDVDITDARLGLQGGSVRLGITFTCTPGLNVAYGIVDVTQTTGERLAHGSGAFEKAFPGAPCTGRLQGGQVTVFNSGPWAFHRGAAAATAAITLFDDGTGDLVSVVTDPQAIKVVAVSPAPEPATSGPPALDPRYRRG